jgi:copper chaperone CopZ
MQTLEDRTLSVVGMSCGGCEARINGHLRKLDGVRAVAADHQRAEVRVLFDGTQTSLAELCAALTALGYEVQP